MYEKTTLKIRKIRDDTNFYKRTLDFENYDAFINYKKGTLTFGCPCKRKCGSRITVSLETFGIVMLNGKISSKKEFEIPGCNTRFYLKNNEYIFLDTCK